MVPGVDVTVTDGTVGVVLECPPQKLLCDLCFRDGEVFFDTIVCVLACVLETQEDHAFEVLGESLPG